MGSVWGQVSMTRQQLLQLLLDRDFAKLISENVFPLSSSSRQTKQESYPIFCLASALLGDVEPAISFLEQPLEEVLQKYDNLDIAGLLLLFSRLREASLVLGKIHSSAIDAMSPLEKSIYWSRMAHLKLRSCDFVSAEEFYIRAFEEFPHLYHLCNVLQSMLLRARTHPSPEIMGTIEGYIDRLEHFSIPPALADMVTSIRYEFWAVSARDALADARLSELYENNVERLSPELFMWVDSLCHVNRHDDALSLLKEWGSVFVPFIVARPESSPTVGSIAPALAVDLVYSCLIRRADINFALGRYQHAALLCEEAVAVPDNSSAQRVDALVKRGHFLLACFSVDEARSAVDRASMELDNVSDPEIKSELGIRVELARAQVLAEQEPSAALGAYRRLLARSPYNVGALVGLGYLHLRNGDLSSAIDCYRRAYSIDSISGFSALSSSGLLSASLFLEESSFSREELLSLESFARTPGMEGGVNASLLYGVGRAWEHLGEYERAFEAIRAAAEALKPGISYSPSVHRIYTARILRRFSREFVNATLARRGSYPSWPSPSIRPIFIVGMPRSGTTLVEEFLSAHSSITPGGELGVVPQTIASIEQLQRVHGSGRHYPEALDDLTGEQLFSIAAKVQSEYEKICQKTLADIGGDVVSSRYITDKLPHNFENIGFIKMLFPEAKIIYCRRDYRDVAISNYFTNFQARNQGLGYSYDLEWLGYHLADHEVLFHFWANLYPDDIFIINYEKLTSDPVPVLRPVIEGLGLEWEDALSDHRSAPRRPIHTASVAQVRKPLNRGSVEKWRKYENYLSKLEAAYSEPFSTDIPGEYLLSLPEPGLLGKGVDSFYSVLNKRGAPLSRFDEAEMCFKKILLHVPGHAAATFMLGLVYVEKGHPHRGLELMRAAFARSPRPAWREDISKLESILAMQSVQSKEGGSAL